MKMAKNIIGTAFAKPITVESVLERARSGVRSKYQSLRDALAYQDFSPVIGIDASETCSGSNFGMLLTQSAFRNFYITSLMASASLLHSRGYSVNDDRERHRLLRDVPHSQNFRFDRNQRFFADFWEGCACYSAPLSALSAEPSRLLTRTFINRSVKSLANSDAVTDLDFCAEHSWLWKPREGRVSLLADLQFSSEQREHVVQTFSIARELPKSIWRGRVLANTDLIFAAGNLLRVLKSALRTISAQMQCRFCQLNIEPLSSEIVITERDWFKTHGPRPPRRLPKRLVRCFQQIKGRVHSPLAV